MAAPGRVARALPGLLLAMGIAALDQTALSPALPAIAGDLGGLDAMPLVVSAYLVAATAVMPVYGRLGDTVGRVPLLQAALALFGLGAAASALAPDLGWLVAGRIVQGAGGGGLMIGAQAAVGDLVSPRERGRYLGLFGAVYAVAAVAGPVLGGIVADAASWRWIFAVHPPLALIAMATMAATLRLPRPDRTARPRFDAAGALGLPAVVFGAAQLAGAPGSGA
ncbi:MFS transporter, partial [Nocardiopsis coralliicola]